MKRKIEIICIHEIVLINWEGVKGKLGKTLNLKYDVACHKSWEF